MMFMAILMLFLGGKVLDYAVAIISPSIISYLGSFAFPDILTQYQLPQYIKAFANFDGVHYLRIAKDGYGYAQQAFFPLYPSLINLTGSLVQKNYLIAGLLISYTAFLAGLFVFRRYLKILGMSSHNMFWIMLFLITFPTSFFFGVVYTESLFFLLFISSLFFFQKKNYLLAGVTAFLAALTKFIGVFLFVPFLILFLFQSKKITNTFHSETLRQAQGIKDLTKLIRLPITHHQSLITIFSPILGLSLYSFYLLKTTGDPIAFFHAQDAFERSTNLVLLPQVYFRYLKIFLTAQWDYQYFIAAVEFVLFSFVLIVLLLDLKKILKNRDTLNASRFSLNTFSLINLLLPTATGTLLSTPRFALMSLSIFLFLGELKSQSFKLSLLFFFSLLHIILLAFFIQGYFVS